MRPKQKAHSIQQKETPNSNVSGFKSNNTWRPHICKKWHLLWFKAQFPSWFFKLFISIWFYIITILYFVVIGAAYIKCGAGICRIEPGNISLNHSYQWSTRFQKFLETNMWTNFEQCKWWLLKFASKFWSEMEIYIICSFDWWRIH